jgi:hypothetical protein
MVRSEHETSTHYFSCSDAPGADRTNSAGRRYVEHVFLHSVGSVGHVMCYVASGVRNVDALFFMLNCTGADRTNSASGDVMPNLCFLIWWDLRVTSCI